LAQVPVHSHPRDKIEVPAILEPHQGTSYNPPAEAHQELLLKAHELEEKRVEKAAKLAEVRDKFHRAKLDVEEVTVGVPAGMKVDDGEGMEKAEEDEGEKEEIPRKKMPERKTRAQRNKAAKVLMQVRGSRFAQLFF
jgi:nucleolar protein 53